MKVPPKAEEYGVPGSSFLSRFISLRMTAYLPFHSARLKIPEMIYRSAFSVSHEFVAQKD
jgi:hypothetical protein